MFHKFGDGAIILTNAGREGNLSAFKLYVIASVKVLIS